jgi:hypothetical protein
MNLPTSKSMDGVIGIRDFRGELIRAFTDKGWIYHSEVCIWKDPVTAMQRTKALGLLHKTIRKDSSMARQGLPGFVEFETPNKDNPDRNGIHPGETLQRESAREHKDERHICPLQLPIIERAINLWTNPGDLVFSPFAGIGSEGVVALKLKRRFLGAELKRSYWEQARLNLMTAKTASDERELLTEECFAK